MTSHHGCGTTAGYVRHRRSDEAACPACKEAWRTYYRELRRPQKGSK